MRELALSPLDDGSKRLEKRVVKLEKESRIDTLLKKFHFPALLLAFGGVTGGVIVASSSKEDIQQSLTEMQQYFWGNDREQDPDGEYRKYCKEKLQETIDISKKQPFEVPAGTLQRILMLALGAEDFDTLFKYAEKAEKSGVKNGEIEKIKIAAFYRCRANIILGKREEKTQPAEAMKRFEEGKKQALVILEVEPENTVGAYCSAYFSRKLGRPDADELFKNAKKMGNFQVQIQNGYAMTQNTHLPTSRENSAALKRAKDNTAFLEEISSAPPLPNKK